MSLALKIAGTAVLLLAAAFLMLSAAGVYFAEHPTTIPECRCRS